MNEKKEIPQGAVWAIIAVVVIGVIVGAFMMSGGPAPKELDPTEVSPTRLEDPDPRSAKE